MAFLKVAVFSVTLMSTLLSSSCAPIEQTNASLPYYCDVEITSTSGHDLIIYLGTTVNNPIIRHCPFPTCNKLVPHDEMNDYHLQGVSSELESFRGIMKLTVDGPCAELKKKAAVLPLKYFDENSTYYLEYCKNIELIFKESTRHIARFVMSLNCGCNNTCEYNPGKLNVPSVPEGQDITFDYVVTQQWTSLSSILLYVYRGTSLV